MQENQPSERGGGRAHGTLGGELADGRISLERGPPGAIPDGYLLVRNGALEARVRNGLDATLGLADARAWLQPETLAEPSVASCECGWAPELGDHYAIAPP